MLTHIVASRAVVVGHIACHVVACQAELVHDGPPPARWCAIAIILRLTVANGAAAFTVMHEAGAVRMTRSAIRRVLMRWTGAVMQVEVGVGVAYLADAVVKSGVTVIETTGTGPRGEDDGFVLSQAFVVHHVVH